MKIRYWSDYSCPFCYIGVTRLNRAIERLGIGDNVEIERLAFELSPEMEGASSMDTVSLFAKKYSMDREKAERQISLIEEEGRRTGLDIHLDKAVFCNTREAHRLYKFALGKGKDIAEKTADLLFEAFFTKGENLCERETLLRIAEDAGLQRSEAAVVLGSGAFEDDIIRDENEARALSVTGVPFFLIDDKYYIPGAIPEAGFIRALKGALAQEEAPAANGNACGPGGC
ncbi:MAG: DsbA family oxidoreductase [Bacteroidales bacterium]|nr:DsbA family oxidoreductase [Bacteroidales bacterium]